MDNPRLIGSIKGVRENADESRMNSSLEMRTKRDLKNIRIVHTILYAKYCWRNKRLFKEKAGKGVISIKYN